MRVLFILVIITILLFNVIYHILTNIVLTESE